MLHVREVIQEGHVSTVNEQTESGRQYLSDKQMCVTRNTAYFGRTFFRFHLHQNNQIYIYIIHMLQSKTQQFFYFVLKTS